MTTQLKNSQTFRVFFSSPFKGMEEEREELTRKYIPEIQHRCAEMGLQFVTVDMRWGISVESAQEAQTVNICLKEIDRCDMFVNFFGQRYGWQGHTDALLQENINTALGKYPWLDEFRDRSVTELELRHGFLNNPGDIPTVVCFRDKKYDDIMKDIHKDKAVSYTVENELCADKLNKLKAQVLESQSKALAVHVDYPNPFEGARLIYEAIIKYLNENVLKQSGELPRREKDSAPHKAFAASRTTQYVANQEHYDFLNSALKSNGPEGGEGDRGCGHVAVTGPAGCGKSALLCNWLHSHLSQLPDVIAIPYYVGCAPSTRDAQGLLDFVYGELEYHLGDASKENNTADGQTDSNNSSSSSKNKGGPKETDNLASGDGPQTDGEQTSNKTDSVTGDATNPVADGKSDADSKGAGSGGHPPDSFVRPVDPLEFIGHQLATTDNTASDLLIGHQLATTDNTASSLLIGHQLATTDNTASDLLIGHQLATTDNTASDLLIGHQLATTDNTASDQPPDTTAASQSDEKGPQNEDNSAEEDAYKGAKQGKTEDSTTTDGNKNTADTNASDSGGKTDKTATDGNNNTAESFEDGKTKTKEESRPKGRELQHQVVKMLERLVEKGHRVVLVFDAVNRLVQANKTSQTLYWLPEKLCEGVLCVVSTDEADQASVSVLKNGRGFRMLHLGPLEEAAKREICVQTLKLSGKELSPAQLDRVVTAKQTENPLFLKIVLTELSIFGYFRKLDEKIDSLIHLSSVKELLQNCLQRMEADYNDVTYEGNLVGEIMKALYVAHQGLTESDICSIFKIPSNVWSPLYFAMEFFIVSHLGNLGFAFTEIREAVKERYLPDATAVSKARKRLITYFDDIRKQLKPWTQYKKLSEKPIEHAVMELVWLQRKEEDKAAVINTLTDLAVFRIMNDAQDLELLELWRWTGMKWSEVCSRLLTAVDRAIVDCYLAMEEGALDGERSPGIMMRVAVAHGRAFFDLVNFSAGQEKFLKREIHILENAEGKMSSEEKRREYLRDARYYLACTYATQERYKEARDLHESNMAEMEKALEEKEDEEIRKQIAYTHNGLGIICMNCMDYDKSIEHFTQSCGYHNEKKDHKNEAAGYTNTALVYMYQKNFPVALQFINKALEAYNEALFGQLNMDVGNVYTNMGLIYRRMKDLNKAEEAYLKSLEIKANAVGWDHMVIATAFMNLGTLEMHRKNYAKAEQWTRKAISVYEANELAVTVKEYRRCRENLFVNIMRQEKYEEVMPLYLEVFDILKQNGWMDECLGGMHRKMVMYMIEERPDLLDKAEEISMALIDSSKAHPQSYAHLLAIDEERPADKRPKRAYKYSLDYCLEKFPDHSMYDTIVELKMEHELLPQDDRQGTRTLLKQALQDCSSGTLESIVSKVTTVAREQSKEGFWFQSVKSLLEEEPTSQKAAGLFVRLCVHMERPAEALPSIGPYLDSCRDKDGAFNADLVKPSRTRLDVAKVLVAGGSTAQARQLLLLVTAKSLDQSQKKEAKSLLDSLPETENDGIKVDVTSAA
ncbi:uncharacterized protein LOC143281281 [Babylonia areolata]|uniref:uncharacterized protein LOC143281281 n=1 Tax=Babylonia areolata TaxID=304850 RepID=UPI003FD1AE16